MLALPEGYNMRIGAGGGRLSAGQRQRIGLARAVYGDPALVVLDEPNANLDALGEAALLHTLQSLKASGTTVILITHRPAGLDLVDRFLVLDRGEIRAFGPKSSVVQIMSRQAVTRGDDAASRQGKVKAMWPFKRASENAEDEDGCRRASSRMLGDRAGIRRNGGVVGDRSRSMARLCSTGVVQVEAARKKVQHLEGGIVKEVRVRDGDAVAEGDVLIRLDDTSSGANLRLLQGQSAELAVRRYRLLAERDGAAEFNLAGGAAVRAPTGPLSTSSPASARCSTRGAPAGCWRSTCFASSRRNCGRRSTDSGSRRNRRSSRSASSTTSCEGLRTLFAEGLTPKSRLLALEREAERGRGEMAALAAGISGAETKLQEIELAILKITQTFHEKVAEELRTVEAELNTFSEKLVSVEDQTQRTEIRAPRRGRVLNLAVHNAGSVIKAGETIMEIVPEDDTLVIGARVAPQDIDKVAARAPAIVRLSAFNQRTTPELSGEVQRVSADLVADAGGQASYQAIIEIPPGEAERLQGLVLVPGMPAEVFIRTGARTPLGYLLKPLTDTFSRALRED